MSASPSQWTRGATIASPPVRCQPTSLRPAAPAAGPLLLLCWLIRRTAWRATR
ncbi:hypothetical protein [Streptomyces sp. NPDC059918]|uniref:hypothetical protein n=1 Tax=unclassified Streptomyces TaxID=2593676 RepID=UPI003666E980